MATQLAAVGPFQGAIRGKPWRTYRAAFSFTAGGAGVAAEVLGYAGGVVRVTKLFFTKPSAQITLILQKESTASSGGTSANMTKVPMDSVMAAASAGVKQYTVAPTPGTVVGAIWQGVVATGDVFLEEFGERDGSQVILRGTSEGFVLNVSAGAALTGYLEWLEGPA